MAVPENLNSVNTWIYHCPPISNPEGYNDFDYKIVWGNEEGSLTIKRNNLIGIKFSANCWNSKDGWISLNSERMLSEPTSQYHTFSQVYLVTLFARNQTHLYWGKRYKIESKLENIYDNGEVISITNTNVDGCLRKYDPHYEDVFGCTPEDVDCEEV